MLLYHANEMTIIEEIKDILEFAEANFRIFLEVSPIRKLLEDLITLPNPGKIVTEKYHRNIQFPLPPTVAQNLSITDLEFIIDETISKEQDCDEEHICSYNEHLW